MAFEDMFMVMHDLCSTDEVSDDALNSLLFACGWTPYEYEARLKKTELAEEHVMIFNKARKTRSN
jgi:hypothetical protein